MMKEKLEPVGKVYRLNENGSLELIGEMIPPEVIVSEYLESKDRKEESIVCNT